MGGCADTSSIDNSLVANTSQLDKAAQETLSFITFHICSQKTSLKVQTLKGKSKSSKARYNDNLNNVIDIVGGKEFICIKMVVVVGWLGHSQHVVVVSVGVVVGWWGCCCCCHCPSCRSWSCGSWLHWSAWVVNMNDQGDIRALPRVVVLTLMRLSPTSTSTMELLCREVPFWRTDKTGSLLILSFRGSGHGLVVRLKGYIA